MTIWIMTITISVAFLMGGMVTSFVCIYTNNETQKRLEHSIEFNRELLDSSRARIIDLEQKLYSHVKKGE